MKSFLGLSFLASFAAAYPGVAESFKDSNPPPYEVYNVAIENSSPDAISARIEAEERRSETATLASIAETRSRADKVLEGLAAIDEMHKQKLSFLKGGNAQDFPVVEMSLASPVNPHPSVSAAIANKEKSREQLEAKTLSLLASKYTEILGSAKAEIAKIISGSNAKSAFLRMSPVEPSVMFNLVQSHPDDSSANAAIDSLENKRQAAESAMLNSAVSELSEFAKVFVSELKNDLGSKSSFLRKAVPGTSSGFHRQLNIKLVPNANYASVSKMAEGMERRRDIGEGAIRAQILDLQLSLAKSLNAFTAAALRGSK